MGPEIEEEGSESKRCVDPLGTLGTVQMKIYMSPFRFNLYGMAGTVSDINVEGLENGEVKGERRFEMSE